MLTLIAIPDNFATQTMGYTSELVADLSPVWGLVVGVLLAMLAIGMLIRFMK